MKQIVITIPFSFHRACGFPPLEEDFFKRCVFAGIGVAGYLAAKRGASCDSQRLIDISTCLGFDDIETVIRISPVETNNV